MRRARPRRRSLRPNGSRLAALRPWADNPRENDDAVGAVAESIRRFGFGAPILARRANSEIIAGHTRWKAAQQLGLDRVPVRFLDLDPVDAHLLALADNRLGEEASWDDAMLARGARRPQGAEADLAATGFTDEEIAKLLPTRGLQDGDTPEPELSRADELRAKWGTRARPALDGREPRGARQGPPAALRRQHEGRRRRVA